MPKKKTKPKPASSPAEQRREQKRKESPQRRLTLRLDPQHAELLEHLCALHGCSPTAIIYRLLDSAL